MRDYLLGSLTGPQLERVEVRLLSDAQFRDELRVAQDELIDDYAFGVLAPGARRKFEQNFLTTPERAEKLRFARAVKGYLEKGRGRLPEGAGGREVWWRRLLHAAAGNKLLTAFSLAACLFAAVIFFVLWAQYKSRVEQQELARALAARAETSREVERWTKEPPAGFQQSVPLADLTLTPGVLRGTGESDGSRRVILTEPGHVAQLKLEIPDQRFESYTATLLTNEEDVILDIGALRPESEGDDRFLIIRIPQKFLPRGEYELRLRGTTAEGQITDAGRYPFQVVNRNASR